MTPHCNIIKWQTLQLKDFKRKSLSEKTAEGLKILNPKRPKCYITPKIRKGNNPGRPAINSIKCHTS